MTNYKHLLQQLGHRSKTLSSHSDGDKRHVQLGYTSVIFVDLGAKVDRTYTVTCFCHSSCCLPYVMFLASLCFRKQCPSIQGRYVFRH